MITDDAFDITHWEDWQRDYRYGSFVLFPPEPIRSQVNALRHRYDPSSQAICDAHISLTVPLPRDVSETQWREIAACLADWRSFEIRYGPLRHYLPHPGVCLDIEPQTTVGALMGALEATSVFRGAPARGHRFSAHMTIAEFVTERETLALIAALAAETPTGRFLCTGVSYAVPDRSFHFEERRFVVFGAQDPAEARST